LSCLIGLINPTFLLYSVFLTTTWSAILVCLEHSFWIIQQGSSPSEGFTKAWILYLKTQCALANQELNDYLMSKGNNDWFTTQYSLSEAEYAEYRKIVLNNLLCKSSPFFFTKFRELLTFLQPILNLPLDQFEICWESGMSDRIVFVHAS
jgi:hypothetical protein